jgi:hypothetical protein
MVMTRYQFVSKDYEGRTRATQIWKNFMAHIHTFVKTPFGVWDMAHAMLAEYNARIVEKDYIEFETEEDQLLFILRWS